MSFLENLGTGVKSLVLVVVFFFRELMESRTLPSLTGEWLLKYKGSYFKAS